MDPVAQVTTALEVLRQSADEAAWHSGFVQRPHQAKLSGAQFVLTLVGGFLREPQATRSALAATAGQLGVAISPQGLQERLDERGARCLQLVLGAVARAVVEAAPAAVPILDRFTAVYVQDSTTVVVPDALAEAWPGCGGRTEQGTQAAVKLQVRWDLRRGGLRGPELHAGRVSDQVGELVDTPGEPGSLHLRDLGYFSLERLDAFTAAAVYWLTRLKQGTRAVTADGADATALAWLQAQGPDPIDVPVTLGTQQAVAARLLAVRVPAAVAQERRRKLRAEAKREGKTPSAGRLRLADWQLLVTNVPADQLSVAEALVLARARWQIELLFKLWKQQRRLERWRGTKPWSILCELWAKLIGLVVQHWLLLVACWEVTDRSLPKAAQVVGLNVGVLLAAYRGRLPLTLAVEVAADGVQAACRLNPRRRYPSTAQLLAAPTLPWHPRPRPVPRRGRKPAATRQNVA